MQTNKAYAILVKLFIIYNNTSTRFCVSALFRGQRQTRKPIQHDNSQMHMTKAGTTPKQNESIFICS
jgi:hypothetical protein